jgi:hypothetical protein
MAPFSRATAPPPPGASNRSRQMLYSWDVRGTPTLPRADRAELRMRTCPKALHLRMYSHLSETELSPPPPPPLHLLHAGSVRPGCSHQACFRPTRLMLERVAYVTHYIFTRRLPTMSSRKRMRGFIGARTTRVSFAARGHALDDTLIGIFRSTITTSRHRSMIFVDKLSSSDDRNHFCQKSGCRCSS